MLGNEKKNSTSYLVSHFSSSPFQCYRIKVDAVVVICSHEEIDVSHPDFFASAKLNGYVPPNKEVINTKSCTSAFRYRYHPKTERVLKNVKFPCLFITSACDFSSFLVSAFAL